MTAGRRAFSIRAMCAATAGSWVLEDCGFAVVARPPERLLAESLEESTDELERIATRRASTAVRRRVLVAVDFVVFAFMASLMGANRITFGCDATSLVGWRADRITLMKRLRMCFFAAEEVDEEIGNAGWLFVLEPVRGVGESVEIGDVAVAKGVVGHLGEEEGVALAPKYARGDVDGGVGELGVMTGGGAIPVDHRGKSAGLRPRRAVLREVFGGECVWAAGAC